MTVPVYAAHEIVSVGSDDNASCEVKFMVIVFPDAAYHVFVPLLELNVVVPVSNGVSLSILICADV